MAAVTDTNIRPVPPWRARVERFWRWWTGELLGMVPALAGATRVPLIALDGTAVVLLEPRPADGAPGERVEVAELDAARAAGAVRAMLERAGESRGRARLALAPGEALVRRVTMPAATEENLGSVLGFEMDRLTPFRSEEVYHDHRVISRDAAAGTIGVLLALARREVVDARLAQMRELGVSVQGVAVREEVPRSGPALDVLPSAQRGERERPRERIVKQSLGAAALVLLVAALAIPALRKRADVHAIKPALDKAYTDAQSTDTLVRELERQVADYNFLLAKKHGTGPTLAYIEEVTRLLPDNTWLQQFEIKATGKAREVQIVGETISASKLIEILEQSQLLQNAAPRGTITRGSTPGTERFVIAAEARARPQPESRPVTESQAASPPPSLAPVTATPAAVAPPASTPASAPAPAPASEPMPPDLIFKPRGKAPSPIPDVPKAPGS